MGITTIMLSVFALLVVLCILIIIIIMKNPSDIEIEYGLFKGFLFKCKFFDNKNTKHKK